MSAECAVGIRKGKKKKKLILGIIGKGVENKMEDLYATV